MAKKQKSGLYRSKVKIGVNADGKDVYKYISGHTKAELEKHRQEVIAFYIDGTAAAEDRLFGEYAIEWFKVRKMPTVSAGTQELYRTVMNAHILPEFGNRKLKAIRATELQAFIQRYAGYSNSYISHIIAIFNGVFTAACQDGILTINPAQYLVKPATTPTAEKYVLTTADRQAIERVCELPEGIYMATLYYLGLRPGEAAGLKWGDFDWQKHLVHIQRDIDFHANGTVGELKTKRSNRYIPVPEPLMAILYPRRELPDMFLVHTNGNKPLTIGGQRGLWKMLMSKAGMIDNGKPRFTAHTLRHNYITMCYENGIEPYTAMRLAGHSNIATTMNIYTHLSEQQLEKTGEDVNAMFQKNSCTKVAQGDSAISPFPPNPHTP